MVWRIHRLAGNKHTDRCPFFLLALVRRAARRYGLREAQEGDDWTLFWTDCSVSLDRVKDLKRYQVLHRTCSHIVVWKKTTGTDWIASLRLKSWTWGSVFLILISFRQNDGLISRFIQRSVHSSTVSQLKSPAFNRKGIFCHRSALNDQGGMIISSKLTLLCSGLMPLAVGVTSSAFHQRNEQTGSLLKFIWIFAEVAVGGSFLFLFAAVIV